MPYWSWCTHFMAIEPSTSTLDWNPLITRDTRECRNFLAYSARGNWSRIDDKVLDANQRVGLIFMWQQYDMRLEHIVLEWYEGRSESKSLRFVDLLGRLSIGASQDNKFESLILAGKPLYTTLVFMKELIKGTVRDVMKINMGCNITPTQ